LSVQTALALFFCAASRADAQLILPMPGQQQQPSSDTGSQQMPQQQRQQQQQSGTQKPASGYSQQQQRYQQQQQQQQQQQRRQSQQESSNTGLSTSSGLFLPMPGMPQQQPAQTKPSGKTGGFIPPAYSTTTTQSEQIAEEIVPSYSGYGQATSPQKQAVTPEQEKKIDELLDSQMKPQMAAAGNEEIEIFPRDTSAALFMMMKTWECEDYDARTLLTHAVKVYAEDAGETFEINFHLPATEYPNISCNEEDVTLDELLDEVTSRLGYSWGADIPNGVIHIYPGGLVAEDEYSLW